MNLGTNRLISSDVTSHQLEESLDPGALSTREAQILGAIGDLELEVGLWEANPGTDTDVEIDEVFLVLSGSGVVTFEDGSSIELKPGVLVRLYAGDKTTWQINDRMRKLYIA